MKRRIIGTAAITTVVILAGCSGGTTVERGAADTVAPNAGTGDGSGAGPGDGDANGDTRAALRPLGDRDTFFTELRGALTAQGGTGGTGEEGVVPPGTGLEVGGEVADAPAPGAPPGTDDAGGGAEGGGAGFDVDGASAESASIAGADTGRLEVTETNVQERGVDEQDRVKVSSDGTRLYVLRDTVGDVRPLEPFVVEDAATGEPIEIEPGDGVAIDPLPGFVPPTSRTTLRILGLEPAAVDAVALRDVEIDLGGRRAEGMYLHEGEAGTRVLLTASGGGGYYWDVPHSFGGLDAVVTRIDVDDPATAAISASVRIDGQIVSSRRIGKHLFVASRFYPAIPGPRPWELSAGEWAAAVEAIDDEALLPGYTDGTSGERRALIDPERCFVAPRPANDRWYTPDIVTLAVIDIDTMALADSECYLGASETLYASPEGVYLATTRWDHRDIGFGIDGDVAGVDPEGVSGGATTGGDTTDGLAAEEPAPLPTILPDGGGEEPGSGGEDIAPYEPRVETDIHRFDIDGGSLAYRGSGSVRGHLGFDPLRKPFRLSARDGYLRVASVNETFGFDGRARDVSPIVVTVLRPDGEGALERVAELPNAERPAFIGKPGERLYASRFVGDRAYLVTFRQTDPLYVIDLADPADPEILGELEIEGYSDYLLPIDGDHLLGIGRDAVAAPGGGERGAFVLGVKLSLFDVGDPAAPREVDSVVVGQRGTQAAALFDHRGITVQRATDDHPTRVSFGIDVAGAAFPTERPDPSIGLAYYDWTYTGLHGFDVRGGDGAGIEPRGAMVVERRGQDGRLYGGGGYDDRAVMVGDATYYVHGGEVFAAPWDDLASPGEAR